MSRKKWLTSGVCLLLAGSAAALFAQRQAEEPVDKKTYDAIKPGLTEAEVRKLIPVAEGLKSHPWHLIPKEIAADGKGWFNNDEVTPEEHKDGDVKWVKFYDRTTGKLVGWVRWWETETYSLYVLFNDEGKVRGRTLYKFEPARTKGEKMIDFVRDLW